jgi:lysophospholipase L1-like esterase
MIDCLIVGDSIAVGTHQYRPECVAYAKGGINSWQWNKQNPNKNLNAKTVIISLGSNDHAGVRTLWELQQLRGRVDADRVFWILPAIKPDVQEMVRIVAKDHGDTVLPILNLQADKIHPSWAGYKKLAEQTQ